MNFSYTIGEGTGVALSSVKVLSVTSGAFVSLDEAGKVGERLIYFNFFF